MSASTTLPWRTPGARLRMPRDLDIAYVVGRMALATAQDLWPLFYGSPHTARFGFLRLARLGLLRPFPRKDLTQPLWYTLAPDARAWVAEAAGCEETDLRTASGIARANLVAVRARNRLWVSTVLACRASRQAAIALFRPEWELRRARAGQALVPDAQVVLTVGGQATEIAWFLEFDEGTERLAVWREKARVYAEARRLGALYGESAWALLAVVPSARRARSVARACGDERASAFTYVTMAAALHDGRALEHALWKCEDLLGKPDAEPRWSLAGTSKPINEADQRSQSTVDRPGCEQRPEVSR